MDKLKTQVEYCLRNFPETRNSDITLTIKVWRRFHISKTIGGEGMAIHLSELYELPREDNIKRIRADFNSKKMYYPTDWEIAKRRGIEENKWRVTLGYPTKEETAQGTRTESYMDTQQKML